LDNVDKPVPATYSSLSSSEEADSSRGSEVLHCFADYTRTLVDESHAMHDELRLDFEKNGTTLDMTESHAMHNEFRDDFDINRTLDVTQSTDVPQSAFLNMAETYFTPISSSTPMPTRRMINFDLEQVVDTQQNIYQVTAQETRSNLIPAEVPIPPFHQTYRGFTRNKRNPRRRTKPNKKSLEDHCVFCKNNGAPESVYKCHTVKDSMGRVLCPTLRQYKCPICGEDGDRSHTVKSFPERPIITMEDTERMDRIF